jgi:antitoxin (DNA-binding transcriptional repressor) of toxin-antitoxin stability system
MKRASVTYTKNNLSRVLGLVREGASVLVVDRDVPVARLGPVNASELEPEDRLRLLERRGVATAPRRALDAARFTQRKKAQLCRGASAVQALLEDREGAR